ncbi:hypothetical protein Nepgr_002666 [Nepenthes gracilis]|uniref:Uncharacterized protein n=1 Tax=Nepenthes gracilis TaxID=150966 RepID=A0AAD3RX35_NEPGR|nr:hypothetical protein Nepgr_002666 [Nepenthes gracilis]
MAISTSSKGGGIPERALEREGNRMLYAKDTVPKAYQKNKKIRKSKREIATIHQRYFFIIVLSTPVREEDLNPLTSDPTRRRKEKATGFSHTSLNDGRPQKRFKDSSKSNDAGVIPIGNYPISSISWQMPFLTMIGPMKHLSPKPSEPSD